MKEQLSEVLSEVLTEVLIYWIPISNTIKEPTNEHEYELLKKIWEEIVDEIGDDEKHWLCGLLDIVSYLLEEYDHKTYGEGSTPPNHWDIRRNCHTCHKKHD